MYWDGASSSLDGGSWYTITVEIPRIKQIKIKKHDDDDDAVTLLNKFLGKLCIGNVMTDLIQKDRKYLYGQKGEV